MSDSFMSSNYTLSTEFARNSDNRQIATRNSDLKLTPVVGSRQRIPSRLHRKLGYMMQSKDTETLAGAPVVPLRPESHYPIRSLWWLGKERCIADLGAAGPAPCQMFCSATSTSAVGHEQRRGGPGQ
ncbi:hypothetical protein [Bradyrhizobium sp. CCBAU 51745]|uniref:hypothetical protein n=1 Tax=Bradyrhizobium sp. CCBAU 51745 TaxID=1325099 RepID=UPI0023054525|nr:hypothetical protein [Bradyrhizobium sp. CCBAU 51745]